MDPDKLIKMANQIGAFFDAMPDADQQVAGIAEHIQRFWEPRMQRALADYLKAQGDAALMPVVRQALGKIETFSRGPGKVSRDGTPSTA